jgi:hypothetical protein
VTQPCGWTVDPGCCDGWDDFAPEVQARAENLAILTLWRLSGRRFSQCEVTVRPCFNRLQPRSYATFGVWLDYGDGQGFNWLPYQDIDGDWRNCPCSATCICGASCEVALPAPVSQITEIRINNVVLATGWRVEDRRYLIRQDGQCWPERPNMDVPADSTDNTFTVKYLWGSAVPADAAAIAGELACEFAKFCTNQPCALSPEVTSISRDGVTFQVVPVGGRNDTPTGLANVDLWLRTVNPSRLRQSPGVSTPDIYPARVTTQVA